MQITIDSERNEDEFDGAPESKRTLLQTVPSWLLSFFIHMILLLSLATLTLPASPIKHAIALLSSQASDGDDELSTEIEILPAPQPSVEVGSLMTNVRFSTLDVSTPRTDSRTLMEIPQPKLGLEFFGIYGAGERFAYVIDRSSSMKGAKFEQACDELMRSIQQLKSNQHFYVVFFDAGVLPMFGSKEESQKMIQATPKNQKRLEAWVRTLKVGSGTKPFKSIRLALETRPDTMYLLTDGRFNADDKTIEFFRNKNREKEKIGVRINTIGFEYEDDGTLERLSKQSGGAFQAVAKK